MSDPQTRRRFLSTTIRGSAAVALAGTLPPGIAEASLVAAPRAAGARQIGIVPFDVEWTEAYDQPIGSGLNGRVIRRLATLTPETLITPNEHFFVRTATPALLPPTDDWRISVTGLVDQAGEIAMDELRSSTVGQGVHLLECSGNPRRRSFGLMSACEWSGIPAVDVLQMTQPTAAATQVLIGGFDRHRGRGGGVPGASWIFDPADLESAGAFFATHMNGEPLPPDHGFPVRLFIPGWYGCAAAKWVDRIEWVGDDAPATAQMKEYASRTGNEGIPELARDYNRGEMDFAAMPVRVEEWAGETGTFYRVIGIGWGGKQRVDGLEIRFGEEGPWRPVDTWEHRDVNTWNLWTTEWTPAAPGRYTIRLGVPDSSIPTRRIERGYYDRAVTLEP